jgi:hypothetical protein
MTRYSFWAAFGITPDVQEELERDIKSLVVTYSPNRDGNRHLIDLNTLRS